MLTLIQMLHLTGPLCIDPQLVVSKRRKANRARLSLGSIVYFWRKASTNGNLCDG